MIKTKLTTQICFINSCVDAMPIVQHAELKNASELPFLVAASLDDVAYS